MLFYVIQLLNYYILYKAIKQGSWLDQHDREQAFYLLPSEPLV